MNAAQPTRNVSAGSAGWDLGAMYSLIAELMLNPAARDSERVERYLEPLPESPVREIIARFLATPAAQDVGEYTATLELTPPCPLYLGAHMYDEPTSCRGAGACGRNQYMIELAAIYEHFGVSMGGAEMPDFLPVMIDFMAFSLERPDRDGIGLRRHYVEHYVQPGLPSIRKAMHKYESVYELLVDALQIVVEEDIERLADDPVWVAPDVNSTIPVSMGTSHQPAVLPPTHEMSMSHRERK
ncbi:MAG: molecular chaperone TorD family protein [Thiohalocapsa sp.]